MASTLSISSTADMLQAALSGGLDDSEDWAAAERMAETMKSSYYDSATGTMNNGMQSTLGLEMTYLSKNGSEPTNDEIMEYLKKHRLQDFMTAMIMHVAQHLPLDPFDFLLNHLHSMVMKYKSEVQGKVQEVPDATPQPPLVSPLSPEHREKIVRHIATALQHPDMTRAAGTRLVRQFAKRDEKMTEEDFAVLLKHLESSWGLQASDTKFMSEVLRRWRFRSNSANGTRGLPLWPLSKDEFLSAYPCMLRAIRDRYVPIGAIRRSMFIRQARGDVTDHYDIGARLGRGAFGEVLLVVLKETKEKRVVKRISQRQEKVPEEEVASEVDLLRGLDHPHIMRIFEYFEEDGFINIVMEPVFGGTLTHIVTGLYCDEVGEPTGERPTILTEGWVATALGQMLSALTYAHEVAGVIHKDLKTDNIMMVGRPKLSIAEQMKEPVHVMLADFGISEVFCPAMQSSISAALGDGDGDSSPKFGKQNSGNFRSTRVGGTPSYMSPEMFQGSFTEKSDVWSLGVIFFQMMTGTLPYKADNLLMQANIVSNPRRHPRWEVLSAYQWSLGARKLCQELLVKDEGMRPSAAQALKNEWVLEAKKSVLDAEPMDNVARGTLQQQQLQSHLMRMSMHCITSQLNLSQLQKLNSQFKKYDTTGDGRLSLEEAVQILDDSGIASGEDKDLIAHSLDSDRSGMIEYSEFIAGCLDVASANVRAQIPIAFAIFDLDGSGSIGLEELRLILMQGANDKPPASRTSSAPLSQSMTASMTPGSLLPDGVSVEQVMKDLDVDKNGKVDCFEFERYLLKEHERIGTMLAASSNAA